MAYIEVEGLKEFNQAIRRAKNRELDKRIGQANKRIGEMVIQRLNPALNAAAVGAGRGAKPRASASKREVLLRVGGAHRAAGEHTKMQPWGVKRVTPVGKPTPPRSFVQGTVMENSDDIIDAWGDAIMSAYAPAFAEGQW